MAKSETTPKNSVEFLKQLIWNLELSSVRYEICIIWSYWRYRLSIFTAGTCLEMNV